MALKWFFYVLLVINFEAWGQDPFHQRTTAVVKAHHILKKYRYHGFLKVNDRVYAILKMVGSDYELLNIGMHKGLGQVLLIEPGRICIRKSGKRYCLNRSDTPKAWEMMHA